MGLLQTILALFRSGDRVRGVVQGTGAFEVETVGESHFQEHLDRVAGGKTPEGHQLEVEAVLVLEDENPADPKAVRVDVAGLTVGYLSRANARQYRKQLDRQGCSGMNLACTALIVGGWQREGDAGYYGVRLDLPTEE